MAKIVLDSEAFKALASDTRLQILKALDVRRLTVSELGRVLELNKATVFEHLKQLMAAELVKKEDEGRKWIYYRLTWKGKNILHPENAQIFLTLSVAALGMGGSVFALGRALEWWAAGTDGLNAPEGADLFTDQAEDGSADSQSPEGGQAPARQRADAGEGDAQSAGGEFWLDVDFLFFVFFLAAALVLAAVAFRAWRRRQRDRAAFAQRLQPLDATNT
jgi:DNA-binding transcriptional ArsR family regulator